MEYYVAHDLLKHFNLARETSGGSQNNRWWLHLASGAKMERLGILGSRFSPTNGPVTRLGSPTAPPPAIWDPYLAYLKGVKPLLPEMNGADWRMYPGEPISEEEYHRVVETE